MERERACASESGQKKKKIATKITKMKRMQRERQNKKKKKIENRQI